MDKLKIVEEILPGITEFLEVSLWSEENQLSTTTQLQLNQFVTSLRALRHTANDYDYLPDLTSSQLISASPKPIQDVSESPYRSPRVSLTSEQPCSPTSYSPNEFTPVYLSNSTPNSAIHDTQSSSFRYGPDRASINLSDEINLQHKFQQISTVPQFVLRNVIQNKSRSLPPTTSSNPLPQRVNSNSSMPSKLLSHIRARWSMGREVDVIEQESVYEEAICDPSLLPSSARHTSTPNKARISSPITNSSAKCNSDDITLPRPLRANTTAPPAVLSNSHNVSSALANNTHFSHSAANASRRRFSCAQILDQTWTLVGPLWHRYKSGINKWQPLSFCVLAAGGRLLGFRSTGSSNPVLNLFLVGGHRPVYSGKEGEKDHVFKLTHPTFGTCVLAAPTQEQAMGWIEQIALYCVGQIPAQGKSYLNSAMQDNHEDSGFSAPVSSGSSGEAAHCGGGGSSGHENSGNPANYAVIIPLSSNQPPMPIATTNAATTGFQSRLRISSTSTQDSGPVVLRPSGLLNSVRRKVESIGAKKRMRKVMSLQFTPADDCIISGMAKIRITKRGNWCERLCQLRPYTLEAYRMSSSGTATAGVTNPHHPTISISSPFHSSQADLQLDFALSLDNIQLGVCQEKKHASALKLSCPDASDVMLFEIADKLQMGAWIRGFIQAMGLIPEVSYESINEWLPVGTPVSASRTNVPYPPFLLTTRRASTRANAANSVSFKVSEERPTSYLYDDEEPIYDEVCSGLTPSTRRSPKTSPGASKSLSKLKRGSLPPLPSDFEDKMDELDGELLPVAFCNQLSRRTSSDADLHESSVEPSIPTEESYEEDDEYGEKMVHEEENLVPELPTPTSGRNISLSTSLQNHSRPTKIALSRHQSLCTTINPRRVPPHGTAGKHRKEAGAWNALLTRGCSLADLIAREGEQLQQTSPQLSSVMSSATVGTIPLAGTRTNVYFEYDALATPASPEEVVYELPPDDDGDVDAPVESIERQLLAGSSSDTPLVSNKAETNSINRHSEFDVAFNSQANSTTSSYHSVLSEPCPLQPTSSETSSLRIPSQNRDIMTRSATATTTSSSLVFSSTAPCSPFKYGLVNNSSSVPLSEGLSVAHRASLRCTSLEIANPQIDALKGQLSELKTLKCKLEKCRLASSTETISPEDILLLDTEIRKKDTQLQVLEKESRKRFTIHEANSLNTFPISLSQ